MYNQFERPLKDNQKFKENYKNETLKILFNITDATHAALLIIENGTIQVNGIPQENKEELLKVAGDVDASIQTDMKTFIGMEQMSTFQTIKKVMGGKLKIKGGKNLKVLQDLRTLAEEAESDISEYF